MAATSLDRVVVLDDHIDVKEVSIDSDLSSAALRPVSSDALAHGGACSAANAALALAPTIRIDQSSFMPAGRPR